MKKIDTLSPLYKAIIKSVTGRFSSYIVQFISLAIYARIFTLEEFGVIASIHVFVIFFQMLADVGLGPAIINETTFSENKRDGIFTVTLLLGLILAILFYFFTYFLNDFYESSIYTEIGILICISILFNALNILPITALHKDAKFMEIAYVDISTEIFSFVVVYSLYLQNLGIYALASKHPVKAVLNFISTKFICKNTELGRPSLGREIFHIKSILKFSLYQFGFNFINYFSRNLDNILIGKYFGMSALGIYDKSYQLMRYPLMVTTFAMSPAIQPILTKVRTNLNYVVLEHNKLTSRLMALSMSISFFIYINSKSIILFLFGENWLAVEPLLEIFCVMIPIQSVLSTSGAFFQVMNKPRLLFLSGLFAAFVSVSAILSGIHLGEMKYVASALVLGFSINFIQIYFVLFKFCFKSSTKLFYFGLIKAGLSVLPSLFLYFIINRILLNTKFDSPFFDLIINSSTFLIAILIFIIPIKKALK